MWLVFCPLDPDPKHWVDNNFILLSSDLVFFKYLSFFNLLLIFGLVQGLEKNVNIETLEVANNKITSLKGTLVCMSDHNSGTPRPICLKFWLGKPETGRTTIMVLVQSITRLVFSQSWVPKLFCFSYSPPGGWVK